MIKFDTRDKKPKLYLLAAITAIFMAVAAIMVTKSKSDSTLPVSILCCVYFVAALVILISAYVKQVQYNPYSYNTIIYNGFSLIFLALLFISVSNTVKFHIHPELYHTDFAAADIILSGVRTTLLVLFPFTLLFSGGLCISNISLLRHEGKKITNLLGVIISIAFLGLYAFLLFFDYYVSGSEREVMLHHLWMGIFYCILLYMECMMFGTVAANILVTRYQPEYDKDFVIVLGCGLRKDGTPTPLLQGRIDRALDFYRTQKEKTGKELIFITSGGQGADEAVSESTAMKQYLLDKGVPENQIIEENRSTSTYENMKFSKEIIDRINPDGKVIFSTTNYHLFRSGVFSRRVKMRATGVGAKTKWYFWPNASVREFVGLLTKHTGKQAAVLIGMILIYSLSVLLSYSVI